MSYSKLLFIFVLVLLFVFLWDIADPFSSFATYFRFFLVAKRVFGFFDFSPLLPSSDWSNHIE